MIGFNSNRTMMAAFKSLDIELPFSKKPAMEGAGGGVGEVYEWAIENPDKVSCVYAENPRMYSALAKTDPLENHAPWPKPTCRCFTFAAASTCGSRTIHLRLKGDTRSLAARSRSSSSRARDLPARNGGSAPVVDLSSGQLCRGIDTIMEYILPLKFDCVHAV
jgi:hypothetical protein